MASKKLPSALSRYVLEVCSDQTNFDDFFGNRPNVHWTPCWIHTPHSSAAIMRALKQHPVVFYWTSHSVRQKNDAPPVAATGVAGKGLQSRFSYLASGCDFFFAIPARLSYSSLGVFLHMGLAFHSTCCLFVWYWCHVRIEIILTESEHNGFWYLFTLRITMDLYR